MYSFVDQSTDRLAPGSHFLLRAMRGWAFSASQNRCPPVTLGSSFSRMALIEILGEFHELMMDFHRGGRCRMAFGAIDHPVVGEVEAILLALWADIVAEHHDRTRAVLALMACAGCAERLLARMTRIAAHMSSVGLAPCGLGEAVHPASHGARARR